MIAVLAFVAFPVIGDIAYAASNGHGGSGSSNGNGGSGGAGNSGTGNSGGGVGNGGGGNQGGGISGAGNTGGGNGGHGGNGGGSTGGGSTSGGSTGSPAAGGSNNGGATAGGGAGTGAAGVAASLDNRDLQIVKAFGFGNNLAGHLKYCTSPAVGFSGLVDYQIKADGKSFSYGGVEYALPTFAQCMRNLGHSTSSAGRDSLTNFGQR
jgi:hypothetical protein